MKNEKNRGMKSVITDGTIAEGDIRLLSYWSPSRDIVGWSSNCLLYNIVSIRIYVAFEKKYTSKFEEGKNIFCGREEKRNSNCNGRSSTVTAVTQICCTPLSPLDSTWHLRRSMCGGNNRRPTWKSQKKVQDQENIKYKKEPWKNCLCPSMTGKFHDTSSQWLGPWLWHFAHRIFPSSVVIPEYYSWVIILTNPSEQMKTSAHHFWPPSSLRASSGGSIRRVSITQTLMCILITNFQAASLSNAVNTNISWFEKF